MAEKAELAIVIKAKDEASQQLKGITGNIQGMSKQLKIAGAGMMAAGAGIAFALGKATKQFAEAGDEVHKMAMRTGFGTVALSELKHALEICGADLGLVDTATKKMSKTIVDARDGLETYVRAFDRIGLSAEELMAMKPEDQFMTIATAIASLEDHTTKAAVAQEIFGRAGTQMLPLLAEGADGIRKLRDEAHELGIVFDEEAAESAAAFNDALHRLNESISGVKMAMGEALAPAITKVADNTTDLIKQFQGLSPEMKAAITYGGAAASVFLTLGGGGLLILGFLPQLTKGFGMLAGAVRAFGISVKLTTGLIGMLVVGLGLLTYGIYKLWETSKQYQESLRLQTKLEEEYAKALRGEENELAEVMKARMADIESRKAAGTATAEEIAWLEKHGDAVREWTEDVKAGTDAGRDFAGAQMTIQEELAKGLKELERYGEGVTNVYKKINENTLAIVSAWEQIGGAPISFLATPMVEQMLKAYSPAIEAARPGWAAARAMQITGGAYRETTLQYFRGERVVFNPTIQIQLQNYLDGERVKESVVERIASDVFSQGGF